MLNHAKQSMLDGKLALGLVLGLGQPEMAAIAAGQGFDFMLLDAQHGDWDLQTCAGAFEAIFAAGSIPMVRVRANDPFAIGSMLDRGALGIVVPMVESAEDAQAAVNAAYYPPRGLRSIGGSPLRSWLPVAYDQVHKEIFLAVQIETAKGVEHVGEIMAVDGIDGCWVGPSDLSLSLFGALDGDEAKLDQAVMEVYRACREHNKISGIASPGPGRRWLNAGFQFVTIGSEAGCLAQGAKSLLRGYRA